MKIIGHRGAKGLAPENTLASFTKALHHGVDEIECDARVTNDGVAILEHDALMHDAAGQHYVVADHSYAQLTAINSELTTLSDAIALVNKSVVLQIEVKPKEPIEPIIACLKDYLGKGWSPTDFLVSSKDFGLLQAFHAELPLVPTGIIESWSSVRATSRARKLGTKRISMNHKVLWRGFIAPMNRGGYQLCAYTLDDVKKARRWAKYGLYASITDYPDLYEPKS